MPRIAVVSIIDAVTDDLRGRPRNSEADQNVRTGGMQRDHLRVHCWLGGLRRLLSDNHSRMRAEPFATPTSVSAPRVIVLEENTEVESPISAYSIQPASQTTLLHGFPCRRYGREAAMSQFTFKAKPNFHCSFRARPGCGEFPIHLRCGNEGCTLDMLPWPVQCE